MAKQKQQDEQVWRQVEDERGRLRLDRPFTPGESAANDRENLATLPPLALVLGQERFPDERDARRVRAGARDTPAGAKGSP